MMRVLVLFLMCFCIYLPSTSAELYKNQDYNFQMNIPDGWNDYQKKSTKSLLARVLVRNENQVNIGGGFELIVTPSEENAPSDTLAGVSRERQIEILNNLNSVVREKYPDFNITYSSVDNLGGNNFMIIKAKKPNSGYIFITTALLKNRTNFFFQFVGNDPTGQYEQQFFDMLKTLRPIVGDSDGDFEEEIMYYNDIAK